MRDQATSTSDPLAPAAGQGNGAVVARSSLRRIDLTGADRLRYLEDVTSQTFEDAKPGDVRGTLYLDARGTPLAMFDVAVMADRAVLIAPGDEVATTIVEVLGGRTFLLDATFTRTDDEVLLLRGPDAAAVARAGGVAAPPAGTVRPAGDAVLIGRPHGMDVIGPASALDEVIGWLVAGGAREGDAQDLEAWRVAAGVPAWGAEVVAPHLPEEAGVLPTHVHLAKGCYPGQEAVARMWMLGRPRRRLAVVTSLAEAPLTPGTSFGQGRRAVTVTSAAPAGDVALAYVPSDAVAGDTLDEEGSIGVRVERLVGADDAPPGHDPSVTRRRDRPRG